MYRLIASALLVAASVIGGGVWLASREVGSIASSSQKTPVCVEYKIWTQNQIILTGHFPRIVPIRHHECIKYQTLVNEE